MQMALVEPVRLVPNLPDDVVDNLGNAVALCLLHKRAYEFWYIRLSYEDGVYVAGLAKGLQERPVARNEIAGFESFAAQFPCTLSVPNVIEDRPDISLLRRGNQIRTLFL